MKTQIVAVVFGLILMLANVSFAQTGANYKQQFKKKSVSEKMCTNFSTSSALSNNYKQSVNRQTASFNQLKASSKCCNDATCAKSDCCKDGNCTKDCCHKNNVSANYKHDYPSNKKGGCDMSAACGEHKAACCN